MARIGASGEDTGRDGHHQDEPDAYFFLLKKTTRWAQRTESEVRQSQARITEAVRLQGGKCKLYATSGEYDFLSKVTGVSRAGALKVKDAIDAGGNVTATMLPAAISHKPPHTTAVRRELEMAD